MGAQGRGSAVVAAHPMDFMVTASASAAFLRITTDAKNESAAMYTENKTARITARPGAPEESTAVLHAPTMSMAMSPCPGPCEAWQIQAGGSLAFDAIHIPTPTSANVTLAMLTKRIIHLHQPLHQIVILI